MTGSAASALQRRDPLPVSRTAQPQELRGHLHIVTGTERAPGTERNPHGTEAVAEQLTVRPGEKLLVAIDISPTALRAAAILDRAAERRVDSHSQLGATNFPEIYTSKECVISVRPLVKTDAADLADADGPLPDDAVRFTIFLLRYRQSDGSWVGVDSRDPVRVVSGEIDRVVSVKGQGEHYSILSFRVSRGQLGDRLELHLTPSLPASSEQAHQPSTDRQGSRLAGPSAR